MTARGAFSSLDVVLQFLVQSVCALVIKIHHIVKGQHTRKTAAFVRAAVGFCYITIPSLVSVWARLSLYVLASQVALISGCVSQAEALIKADITLIYEIPKLTESELNGVEPHLREAWLVSYLSNLASTLLVVPGSPFNGPFFLLKALINSFTELKWYGEKRITKTQVFSYSLNREGKGEGKFEVYTNLLALLSGLRQKTLPYVIEGSTFLFFSLSLMSKKTLTSRNK